MKTKQKKIYCDESILCETPNPLIGNSKMYSPNEEINFHSSKISSMEENLSETNKPLHAFKEPENKSDNNVVKIMDGLSQIQVGNSCKLMIVNPYQFVNAAIPPGITIETVLKKQSKGLSSILSPQYSLCLKANNNSILYIKNYPVSKQIFKFSLEPNNFSQKSDSYLGCINCNLNQNQFWLRSPVSSDVVLDSATKNLQQLKIMIVYKGNPKIRLTTMMYYGNPDYILGVKKNEQRIKVENFGAQETLFLKEKENVPFESVNKRNFVLQDDEDNEDEEDYEFIRFQQVKPHQYNLQVRHPLSLLQAVSIAMTRFQACLK